MNNTIVIIPRSVMYDYTYSYIYVQIVINIYSYVNCIWMCEWFTCKPIHFTVIYTYLRQFQFVFISSTCIDNHIKSCIILLITYLYIDINVLNQYNNLYWLIYLLLTKCNVIYNLAHDITWRLWHALRIRYIIYIVLMMKLWLR